MGSEMCIRDRFMRIEPQPPRRGIEGQIVGLDAGLAHGVSKKHRAAGQAGAFISSGLFSSPAVLERDRWCLRCCNAACLRRVGPYVGDHGGQGMFKSKAETGRYMKVIVVGAGIAGLSTAWSLTKAGHAVTLVEQGGIPNPLSASGDHHRIIRRAYQAETGYGALITEAYEAWDELWACLLYTSPSPRDS